MEKYKLPVWDEDPQLILKRSFDSIQKNKDSINKIISGKNNISIDNLIIDMNNIDNIHSKYHFLKYVCPNEKTRQICSKIDILFVDYLNDFSSSRQMYNILSKIKSAERNGHKIMFFDKILQSFVDNGILCDDDKKLELDKINRDISTLENQYKLNIQNYNQTVKVSENNLKGVPTIILDNLKDSRKKGKKLISLKSNYANMIATTTHNKNIRKKLNYYLESRCAKNSEILKNIVKLKNIKSTILKKKNYFELINEKNIMKDPEGVSDILLKVSKFVEDKYDSEIFNILKIISIRENKKINSFKNEVNEWDIEYYFNKIKKKFMLDEFEIRKYFPTSHVICYEII
jgi:Zn-dependent oligopeptidase